MLLRDADALPCCVEWDTNQEHRIDRDDQGT